MKFNCFAGVLLGLLSLLLPFPALAQHDSEAAVRGAVQKSQASGGRTRMSASVFTVGKDVKACQVQQPPNDLSYDLAVIQFNDDGTPADTRQLTAAATCIAQARRNPNGAIVLLFIHGWHHNAEWNTATDEGDSDFRAFRDVLFAMTRREAERYFPNFQTAVGRRVVGIYIGWNGDPSDSWLTNAGPLTHLSFWTRYSTAKRIGDGSALRDTIRAIVARTKDRLPSETTAPAPESPLILIGHSMGRGHSGIRISSIAERFQ
jgi:hypothetical protein